MQILCKLAALLALYETKYGNFFFSHLIYQIRQTEINHHSVNNYKKMPADQSSSEWSSSLHCTRQNGTENCDLGEFATFPL